MTMGTMIEQCDKCNDAELIERKATASAPYQYRLSGLSNVWLSGITVLECPLCKTEFPKRIPRIGELHRVIADCLIAKKSPLTGEEIRYLRKYAGFPAKDLAVVLGVTPAYLSRVETGKKDSLGAAAERLVRVLAMDRTHSGEVTAKLLELAQQIGKKVRGTPCPVFQLQPRGWRQAA